MPIIHFYYSKSCPFAKKAVHKTNQHYFFYTTSSRDNLDEMMSYGGFNDWELLRSMDEKEFENNYVTVDAQFPI